MQLHHIEPQAPGIRRRAGERRHGIGDVFLRHRDPARFFRPKQAGRTLHRRIGLPAAVRAGGTGVPKLRPDTATCRMHRIDHTGPSGQRRLAVEEGNPRQIA